MSLKKFINRLLPDSCILCGALSQDICESCLLDLPYLMYACPSCARPLLDIKQNLLCGICLKDPPPFNQTLAVYLYESQLIKLIMDLKFNHALVNAYVLGKQMANKIFAHSSYHISPPEVIIPVPLHPHRLRERGFNQALEISRPIAKKLKLPLELRRCQRVKHTAAQATLLAKARQQNIQNAFNVSLPFPYQHIAIVDDVITTGQTIIEFSRALRKAGVKKIDVWCCARPRLQR